MSERNATNRFIRKDDPVISVVRFGENEEWDFAKMQEKRERSWHSRPYEYKFALDRLDLFYKNRSEPGTHLDLACGAWHPGYVIFADLQSIESVVALDLDSDLLKNGMDHPKVEKIISNAESLDFNGDIFDTITCISAIEHMPNWESVLKEAYRVLRPSGELILTVDISDRPELTTRHGVDGKKPQDYIDVATEIGFSVIGETDYSMVDAVDLINSQFPLYEDESDMKEGQHRALKAFRICLGK